jgi:acetyl esterase
LPTLDPQAQALLDAAKAAGASPPYTLPVEEARRRMRAAFISADASHPVHSVDDELVPGPGGGLPVRIYRASPDAAAPAALFLHGGGWVVNDIDTHDHLCRRLAASSAVTVISLEYRRSPEHPYPAAVEDTYAAWRWLHDNGRRLSVDPRRLGVVGDSSGGTLAAVLCLLCRDRGAPAPRAQILGYPVTLTYDQTDSYVRNATGYSLNRDFMRWFLDAYLDERADVTDPYLFPGAATNLAGLPQALVWTAGFDPLCDEGSAYAAALSAAGVPVEHRHLDDQMHGFLMQDRAIDRAREAIDQTAAWLATALKAER